MLLYKLNLLFVANSGRSEPSQFTEKLLEKEKLRNQQHKEEKELLSTELDELEKVDKETLQSELDDEEKRKLENLDKDNDSRIRAATSEDEREMLMQQYHADKNTYNNYVECNQLLQPGERQRRWLFEQKCKRGAKTERQD